jgi:hypothetical protein
MMFHFMMADSTFFNIFSFPLLDGILGCFENQNSMVITRSLHTSVGDDPLWARKLSWQTRVPCTISGCFDNMR